MNGVKPRLLLIGNTLETFGGGERWLLEVATLLKNKYRIKLCRNGDNKGLTPLMNPTHERSIPRLRRGYLERSTQRTVS